MSHRKMEGFEDDGENDDCVWIPGGEGPGGMGGGAAGSDCARRGGIGGPADRDALQYASAVHFLVEVSGGAAATAAIW